MDIAQIIAKAETTHTLDKSEIVALLADDAHTHALFAAAPSPASPSPPTAALPSPPAAPTPTCASSTSSTAGRWPSPPAAANSSARWR
jgi:hypothetical protein